MEKGIILNLYQNLASCFLKGKHFEEAREVIKDIEKLGLENSLIFFKKA